MYCLCVGLHTCIMYVYPCYQAHNTVQMKDPREACSPEESQQGRGGRRRGGRPFLPAPPSPSPGRPPLLTGASVPVSRQAAPSYRRPCPRLPAGRRLRPRLPAGRPFLPAPLSPSPGRPTLPTGAPVPVSRQADPSYRRPCPRLPAGRRLRPRLPAGRPFLPAP